MSTAVARPPVVRNRADKRIRESVDDECEADGQTGQTARETQDLVVIEQKKDRHRIAHGAKGELP